MPGLLSIQPPSLSQVHLQSTTQLCRLPQPSRSHATVNVMPRNLLSRQDATLDTMESHGKVTPPRSRALVAQVQIPLVVMEITACSPIHLAIIQARPLQTAIQSPPRVPPSSLTRRPYMETQHSL